MMIGRRFERVKAQSISGFAMIMLLVLLPGCDSEPVTDDAFELGYTPDDFPELQADVFRGMDNDRKRPLTEAEIAGRNTWNLWTGGSQVFLDWLARHGYGISDVLKMLDSRYRDSRFERTGLINEPGFVAATKPDRWGLWLDVPAHASGMGRTDRMIAEEGIDEFVYGRSTGVLGLRLYPNPEFDEAAQAKWDADRFYDPNDEYSLNPELVRPYRVGMACGVCHIAHNPIKPPENPNNPAWDNLVSTIGNQYFREGAVFGSNLLPPEGKEASSFLWEMVNAQPPGTSDTSRMATDNINNPGSINAIINLPERLSIPVLRDIEPETQSGSGQLLTTDKNNPRLVPHILKDGADSIGVEGALMRVYVNTGLFSQLWLTLHKPLIGVRYQEPFEISKAQQNSIYWQATEQRLANLATFLKSSKPLLLKDASWSDETGLRSGLEYLTPDRELLDRGKVTFLRQCAGCHSSKAKPDKTMSDEVLLRDHAAVTEANFLADDQRHPIDQIKTNACRSLGTNAKRGRIWDNFSSETYKNLPVAVSEWPIADPNNPDIEIPYSLEQRGIRHSLGYYRTPSLVSIWSSAPFLHNNMLGDYNGDPSVPGRLEAFHNAATKLLWPEQREGTQSIWKTQHESYIEVPLVELPLVLRAMLSMRDDLVAEKNGIDMLKIGPIPAGTPINLIVNIDLALGSAGDLPKAIQLTRLAMATNRALKSVDDNGLGGEAARAYLGKELMPLLLANSKCPDLVMDRGHYFGTDLPDADKLALIEYMKTL